uniref:DUF4939 domain-containing protein n=1 Tax=Denticeps clupeoides TaxID=299321 RepID=A0AAY4BIU4_9TELE
MSEPVVDPAEFERVKAEVTYLHRIIDAQATTINTLKDSVLQLSTSMTVLQCELSGTTAGPRIALPDKWNGVDGRPDGLLATLDMIFECYSSHYETSRAKVTLLTSLLSGRAQEWAAALYNGKSPICNDYFLFSEELRKTFVPASAGNIPGGIPVDGHPLQPYPVQSQTQPVLMSIGLHSEHIHFLVISAPSSPLILGYPWLQLHDPRVLWSENRILDWGPACRQRCMLPRTSTCSRESPAPPRPPTSNPSLHLRSSANSEPPPCLRTVLMTSPSTSYLGQCCLVVGCSLCPPQRTGRWRITSRRPSNRASSGPPPPLRPQVFFSLRRKRGVSAPALTTGG